jgi:hypothetical protein
MWILSHTTPQKIGVVLYALVAGAGATVLTSAALFLIGLVFSLMGNAGLDPLGRVPALASARRSGVWILPRDDHRSSGVLEGASIPVAQFAFGAGLIPLPSVVQAC